MQGLVKAPSRIRKFVPHSAEAPADQRNQRSASPVPVLKPERFDQLAHDARNVLSAMKLYCELLGEPGVLSEGHHHYAEELQAVSDTASRLLERIAAPRRAEARRAQPAGSRRHTPNGAEVKLAQQRPGTYPADPWPGTPADDLGADLLAMRPLLAAIAGPRIELEMETLPCAGRTRISKEDVTRIMLNLVRNASEAMPGGGRVRITAQYGGGLSFLEAVQIPADYPHIVAITLEDTGQGIPEDLREMIFHPGFSTRVEGPGWPGAQHRGLGLSIVRGLIEAAGGSVRASAAPGGGARFELQLPVTSGMYELTGARRLVADSAGKGCIECP